MGEGVTWEDGVKGVNGGIREASGGGKGRKACVRLL